MRDYNLATWEGGDPECDHMGPPKAGGKSTLKNDGRPPDQVGWNDYERGAYTPYHDICPKCGAIRHDAGIGLEPTPEEWVANMVQVFREVKRVLRDDGTCWVNIGDSYATSPPGTKGKHANNEIGDGNYARKWDRQLGQGEDKNKIWHKPRDIGLKAKILLA